MNEWMDILNGWMEWIGLRRNGNEVSCKKEEGGRDIHWGWICLAL
jgi:hypothetical protein